MAGVRHDMQYGTGPGPVQPVSRLRRRDHVMAALHQHGWQVGDALHVADQLILLQEHAMPEVMHMQPGGAVDHAVLLQCFLDDMRIMPQQRAVLAVAVPAPGDFHAQRRRVGEQPLFIGGEQVAAFRFRYPCAEPFMGLRIEQPHAMQIPVDFLHAAQQHAAQHEAQAGLGMGLSVGQRQQRTP